ncbi:carbohydrate kinase family protein [Candidatus Dependentiae bacterium]
MKKVLTIGGATQDIYLHYEGADYMTITKKKSVQNFMIFESGEKIEVDNILYNSGGGATNSAVSFKRMGFDTTCFCKTGTDTPGQTIIDNLKKEKIHHQNIIQSSKHTTGTSFIINSLRRERTIFAYRGANGFVQKEDIPFDIIKNSNQLYITSMSYNSAKLLPIIVKFAQKHKIPIATNPGISQLAKGTKTLLKSLKYIDTFILNSSEAKTFMLALIKEYKTYKKAFITNGKENTSTKKQGHNLLQNNLVHENFCFSLYSFFKEILKMGPKIVVVTDGAKGVYTATKNEIFFHPSIKTNVIDTLGAGDSFGSCFVASLLHNYSIQESIRNGILNSSSVISKIGAKTGLLTHTQLKTKIKKMPKNLIKKFKYPS